MKVWIASVVVLLAGCAMNQAQPTTTAAATASPAGFKNLQVLSRDISKDELLATMRSFTRGLGVRCNACHVVTATEPKEVLDFASDAKEEKRVARVMVQMTRQINTEWLRRVEQAEGDAPEPASAAQAEEPRVGCWTCHRGHKEPEMPPPPPAPPANPPAQ